MFYTSLKSLILWRVCVIVRGCLQACKLLNCSVCEYSTVPSTTARSHSGGCNMRLLFLCLCQCHWFYCATANSYYGDTSTTSFAWRQSRWTRMSLWLGLCSRNTTETELVLPTICLMPGLIFCVTVSCSVFLKTFGRIKSSRPTYVSDVRGCRPVSTAFAFNRWWKSTEKSYPHTMSSYFTTSKVAMSSSWGRRPFKPASVCGVVTMRRPTLLYQGRLLLSVPAYNG